MALDKFALVSAGRSVRLSNSRYIHFKNYATDDTLTQVTTAGYFNNSRADLSLNSIIHAVVDCDGTPNHVTLRVTVWSATGDLTAAVDTPAS